MRRMRQKRGGSRLRLDYEVPDPLNGEFNILRGQRVHVTGVGRCRSPAASPSTADSTGWIFRSIYGDQRMLHYHPPTIIMAKFTKHPKYSDGFDTAAYRMTVPRKATHANEIAAKAVVQLLFSR
jgi:hypothetical protein